MAKSLSNLSAQVRQYLDEVTQADWKDTEVTREINAKYMEVYAAVVSVYEDYYSTKSVADSVENQQEYALPSDLYKIRRVEMNYSPSVSGSIARRALPVSMDQVMRDLGNSAIGLTVYRNPAYYIRGNNIGFIPIPTESGSNTITLWYIKTIPELSESSDTIDIPFPDRYGQLISLGAAGVLLRKGQQEEVVAARYLQEFKEELEDMKMELEDRVSDDVKLVVDNTGMDLNFETGFML